MKLTKICVIGLGYIGLPTATVFALAGKQVVGVDINADVVALINQGCSPIQEPQLADSLQQAVQSGRFFAKAAPETAGAFIIAVPTPLNANHQPDLSFVRQAVESIAPVLAEGNLVVLESTSPVGTTEQIGEWLQQLRPDLTDIALAYCPERVLPGRIMSEIYTNDRIIGGTTPEAAEQAVSLYQSFAKGECIPTTARIAEMCKLTENSFRDVNIAFANELSLLCDALDIDVWALIELANRHPRVQILQPGAGVGGHCIAVDPWFIVAQSPQTARLIRTAREVNDSKPQWVIDKVKTALADCVSAAGKRADEVVIACLGLAFKPDVADLRESPALMITEQLAQWHQGEVWAVEPNITQLPKILQGRVSLVDLDCAIEQADIVVLLVDHQPFKELPSSQITANWRVDTRGIWS